MEDCIGERRLLCAVIKQAYRDATGQGGRKALMRDAREWLNSEKNNPFSYSWICKILNIDPSIIRGSLRTITETKINLYCSSSKFTPSISLQNVGQLQGDG